MMLPPSISMPTFQTPSERWSCAPIAEHVSVGLFEKILPLRETNLRRGTNQTEMSTFCPRCKLDMIWADSCTGYSLDIEGTEYTRLGFGGEKGGSQQEIAKRCGDCNVSRGSLHHLYCSVEECPKCGGQLIACGCVPECLKK